MLALRWGQSLICMILGSGDAPDDDGEEEVLETSVMVSVEHRMEDGIG
jgi:hypothetical protein